MMNEEKKKAKISTEYAEAFKQFDWSYAVDALPVPARRRSARTKPAAPSEAAQNDMMSAVVEDLSRLQGNQVMYAHGIEKGDEGFRHLHALLGNISRLKPTEVEACFRAHGFGKVTVKVWSRDLESGYAFKGLDTISYLQGSDSGEWDLNVVWNRKTKQQMKLNRRHLERLLEPKRQPKSAELRRLIAASKG